MADGRILAVVAQAETLRRRRLLTRWLLRIVPMATGASLVTAALVRLVNAPLPVFWIAMAALTAAVVISTLLKGRVPAVTDAAAAHLDADAALNGELRSAHWFASTEGSGSAPTDVDVSQWTSFHLERATARVDQVSWEQVYPPVKNPKVWAGSATMAVAAVALVLSSAWPSAKQMANGSGRPGDAEPVEMANALPEDLQKQLDELISAVQKGTMPLDAARAKVAEMRDKMAALDPQMQAALAKAAQAKKPGDTGATDAKAADLAKRAEKAAANEDLPKDMKWSMQDLAAKLAKASQRQNEEGQQAGEKTGADAKEQQAGAQQQSSAMKPEDASLQMTRSTATDSQSNQMMASTASPMGGEAKGDAKEGAAKGRLSAPLDLAALRKETIQAEEDSMGSNVLSEMRRKSEQSHSTLAFTHAAPLANYDKSHATAPPQPPDALRALVKQYFIRK